MAKKVIAEIKLQIPGGLGFACPAGIWSLISAMTFFAMP